MNTQQVEITCLTWNINYSRRAKGPFEAYSIDSRWNDVCSIILKCDPDIALIQELDNDKIDLFKSTFNKYFWYFDTQNARGSITSIGVGVKKIFKKSLFFSQDFRASLYDPGAINCEKVVGAILEDMSLCIVSVHMPMELKAKKLMIESFNQVVLDGSNVDRLIIGGDFNSFPDEGFWHIPKMNYVCETYSATEFATLKNGQLAKDTFKAYPYDKFTTKFKHSKLDHILVSGLLTKEAIVIDDYMENVMIHPSDHFPILVTLQF